MLFNKITINDNMLLNNIYRSPSSKLFVETTIRLHETRRDNTSYLLPIYYDDEIYIYENIVDILYAATCYY